MTVPAVIDFIVGLFVVASAAGDDMGSFHRRVLRVTVQTGYGTAVGPAVSAHQTLFGSMAFAAIVVGKTAVRRMDLGSRCAGKYDQQAENCSPMIRRETK